jgi:hypothetical protein
MPMLDGIMLLWFTLTGASVVFVAFDIRRTPESPVLKWGFVLLTAYTGPIGAFLYVLGCREPLPGLHERYTATRWRQVLGSTMHCVAGDGVGILAGAALGAVLSLPPLVDIAVEYALGFGFGWTVFQALFMRDMAGGSYKRALKGTFIAEFLSMNLLMAGMVMIVALGRLLIAPPLTPLMPEFWFIMSMALLVGFVVAYPINWWLVARNLKHGMMTVRRNEASSGDSPEVLSDRAHSENEEGSHTHDTGEKNGNLTSQILGMAVLTTTIFAIAFWVALTIGTA